jgi:DNA-binding PadR family transcriptional regulator
VKSYHTLACENGIENNLKAKKAKKMTKLEILAGFADSWAPISPDELRFRLKLQLNRRSFYSYLLRLKGQGLLARTGEGRGRLRYTLTERGRARIAYLRNQPDI